MEKEEYRSDTCEVIGVTAVLRAATAVAVAPRNGVICLIDLATDGASGVCIVYNTTDGKGLSTCARGPATMHAPIERCV